MAEIRGWLALIRGGDPLLHMGCDAAYLARHARGGLHYLATPYSKRVIGPDGYWSPYRSAVVAGRAAEAAEALRRVGVTAVSPVVMADRMVRDGGVSSYRPPVADPLNADAWERWCRPLLMASDSVIVPDIEGWRDSVGIWSEVSWAIGRGRRVFLCEGL